VGSTAWPLTKREKEEKVRKEEKMLGHGAILCKERAKSSPTKRG